MNNELFIIIVILFVLWFINENTKKHKTVDKFTSGDDNEVTINKLNSIIGLLNAIFGSKMHNESVSRGVQQIRDTRELEPRIVQQVRDARELEPSVVKQRLLIAPEPSVVQPRLLNAPEPRVVQQRLLNAPEPRVVQQRLLNAQEHRVAHQHHDVQPRLQEFHHRREQGLNQDLSSSSSRRSTEHKNMRILDNVEAHDNTISQHSPLSLQDDDTVTRKDMVYRGKL